jgi:predicted  nucleic acid-binding Zn-ribbon protein
MDNLKSRISCLQSSRQSLLTRVTTLQNEKEDVSSQKESIEEQLIGLRQAIERSKEQFKNYGEAE